MTALVADPSWCAQVRDEGLVVHAGADSVYLLPDLAPPVAAELAALFGRPDARVVPDGLSAEARLLLPQLRGIGALRLSAVAPSIMAVAVEPAGPPAGQLVAELTRLGTAPVDAEDADLVVVVRTGAPLRALLPLAERFAAAGRPHLLCDLANRRTVVLGPLVVPGLTACLSCLVGRLATRWGDPDPPPRPAAVGEPALVAALLSRALRTVAGGGYQLVERTVALDLDDLTTTAEAVLPASECPACPRVDPIGVRLPWEPMEERG